MRNLEWKYLIGLNQLYENGRTTLRISNNNFISQVLIKQKRLIRPKMGYPNILEAKFDFKEYYKRLGFKVVTQQSVNNF